MVPIGALALPILLSAVAVWLASAVIWMILPYHKSDYRGLPDEDGVREALRKADVSPGMYVTPYCPDRKAMNEPAMVRKFEQGPVAFLTVKEPGKPAMFIPLLTWFVYGLLVSVCVAYITGRVLPPTAEYLKVFRVAGTVAVLTYVGALIPNSIWFGKPWTVTAKEVFDGILYGLLTAGFFGWLWG